MKKEHRGLWFGSVVFLVLFSFFVDGLAGDAPEVPYVKNTDSKLAGWDKEAWCIAARSPSDYEWDNGDKDEICDFTIFQADDGTWQLIACVRKTTFPGFTRMLYQWETTNFFSTHWTEKGVLLTTEDGPAGINYAEGTLQAPHMVKDGDLYYMIYNSANAHLMVSTNGKDWAHQKNSDGGYTLFKMNKGRDVMLMDNRKVDGLWYAVYCGKSDWKDQGGNAVYCHTASDILGPWSDGEVIAKRDHWRDVESPFLMERKGWYYLILQDEVLVQPAADKYFERPIFVDMDTYRASPRCGYAPEIISHPSGQDYIAAYRGRSEPGIEIRPLYWKKAADKDAAE